MIKKEGYKETKVSFYYMMAGEGDDQGKRNSDT